MTNNTSKNSEKNFERIAQKNLPSFLKEARIKAGLSQRDVSEHLGYDTPQFVSNWERGMSMPPITSLKSIAKLYRINADELFETMLQREIQVRTDSLRRKFKFAR